MKIAVCVKQTFDTEAKIVLKDGKISGDGINLIINPYDEAAVEEALRIKESKAGSGSSLCRRGQGHRSYSPGIGYGADRGVLDQGKRSGC